LGAINEFEFEFKFRPLIVSRPLDLDLELIWTLPISRFCFYWE